MAMLRTAPTCMARFAPALVFEAFWSACDSDIDNEGGRSERNIICC